MNKKTKIIELFDMIEHAETLDALQTEARLLRQRVEGEHIIEALAKSNKTYDEIMDFLRGYDD